jgi:hypothetical protein
MPEQRLLLREWGETVLPLNHDVAMQTARMRQTTELIIRRVVHVAIQAQ